MESLLLLTVRGGATTRDQCWWEETLGKNPSYLQLMSREAQLMFPTSVVNSFTALAATSPTRDQVTKIAKKIEPEIWNASRENILQWCRAGLPFLANVHPKDDKEICLVIAECCSPQFLSCSFREAASLSLRNDKAFMLQAIQYNATLINCASKALQQDFDVTLQAFANLCFWDLVSYIEDDEDRQDTAEAFVIQAERKIQLHETFFATLLCGMADESSVCALLNQGAETSIAHKTRVAEYLGVPSSQQLLLLRRARAKVIGVLKERLSLGY